MLLVGFPAALSRSELVALDVADATETFQGLVVTLRRSKTDQEGAGRRVGVSNGSHPATCPVGALGAWSEAAGVTDGPLFLSIDRAGRLGHTRASDRCVARGVRAAGVDPARYAGHSASRTGHLGRRRRASERSIMNPTGHKSLPILRRYIRDGNLSPTTRRRRWGCRPIRGGPRRSFRILAGDAVNAPGGPGVTTAPTAHHPREQTMRRIRILTIAAALTAVLVAATLSAGPASAVTAASCRVTWGSRPKSAPGGIDPLVGVRVGRHACYDRLVIDVRGGGVRDVHYGAVYTQGQGRQLALAGGASLDITLSSPDYDIDTGAVNYQPADPAHIADVAGFDTFRQVAYGGSFEGYTTIGLGVRARLPFRVFVLPGPGANSRLVIDVAHRW